ncbi:MAG: hypothetical protein JNG83_02805 [Opitutaceae bacterium]|nr:hypothetical protein [Opitutaceae bacterium]
MERSLLEKVNKLKRSRHYRLYFENLVLDEALNIKMKIYGDCASAEIYVEVTDGSTTRVKSFPSLARNYPYEQRRAEIAVPDINEAFRVSRQMTRRWPSRLAAAGGAGPA